MSETNKGNVNNETNNNGTPANTGANQAQQKGKPTIGQRLKGWFQKNKKGIIGFGIGAATGVGGSVLAAEYAKRSGSRKNSCYVGTEQEPERSPLDPNV